MALQLLQQAERAKEIDGIVVNSAIRACEQVAHLGCLGMSWDLGMTLCRLEKMVQDGEIDLCHQQSHEEIQVGTLE